MKKIGMIFPGYGNQYVGMAKDIYDQTRTMQDLFETAASCLDTNFVKLCFASSETTLAEIPHAYVSLYIVSVALGLLLQEKGIIPSLVAGQDCGEFGAITLAHGMSVPDALYLLNKFAFLYVDFLKDNPFTAFAVTGVNRAELQEVCNQVCDDTQCAFISIQETETNFIVTGHSSPMKAFKKLAKEHNYILRESSVGGGIHNQLMDELLKNFTKYLAKVDFKPLQFPFITSVTGQALTGADAIRAALMQQIHAPINWHAVLETFVHCDLLIILGTAKETFKALKKMYPEKELYMIHNMESLNECVAACGQKPFPIYDDMKDKNNGRNNKTGDID